MSTHFTADELADAAAGALTADQTAEIDRHVTSCPTCTTVARDLRAVTELLASTPAPTMPTAVADRLDAALTAEATRRASGEAERDVARRQAEHAKRLTTGSFGENAPTKRHTGIPEVDSAGPLRSAGTSAT